MGRSAIIEGGAMTRAELKKLYESVEDAERFALLEERLNEKIEQKLQENLEAMRKYLKETEESLTQKMASAVTHLQGTLMGTIEAVASRYDKKLREDLKKTLIAYKEITEEGVKNKNFDLMELSAQIGEKLGEILKKMQEDIAKNMEEEHLGTQRVIYDQVDDLKEYIHKELDKMEYNLMVDNAKELDKIMDKLKEVDWHILRKEYAI